MPWRARFPAVGLATNILLRVFRVHQPFFFFALPLMGVTGIINQIRAFMLDRWIAVRQGIGSLRAELPNILATRTDALSPRMLRVIEELAGDWRRLDQRIDGLSGEIEALARQDQACSRLMTVPGPGPIISSAMVAAIGTETRSPNTATSAPGSDRCPSRSPRETHDP
jgi:transposase